MSQTPGRDASQNADLIGLSGDAILDLFELDLLPLTSVEAYRFFRFCNWVQTDGSSLSYAGITYQPIPVALKGMEVKGDGTPPNPSVTVSNIGLDFTALANDWNDLIGAKFIRRRVLRRHLDDGSNPNSSEHWPDEIWFIEQKSEEDKITVTFQLASAFDLDGVALPRRRALRSTCPWIYRGPECGYAGPPVSDEFDETIDLTTTPEGQNYNNALTTYENARTALDGLLATYKTKQDELNTLQTTLVLNSTQYNSSTYYIRGFTNDSGGISHYVGVWNGQAVSNIATTDAPYRPGNLILTNSSEGYNEYQIQRWEVDSTAISAKEAEVASAKTTYDNHHSGIYEPARTSYETAKAAFQTFFDAQSNTFSDKCGKRLSSCRKRFHNESTNEFGSLPFGGFPGLAL